MAVNSLAEFLGKLKMCLDLMQVPPDSDNVDKDNIFKDYLDLAEHYRILDEHLQTVDKLSFDPLSEAFCLIINELNRNKLDKGKMGINELLKFYLRKVQKDNQVGCTHLFMTRIKYIFLYSLLDSFPFTELLWRYMCKCIQPVGFYLLEKQLNEACLIYSDYISIIGKTAARHGLPTDKLQHFLRMTEVKALEVGLDKLAGHVKNHRHNIES
ncbi:hypothetical protein [Desulfitibacter alkalitolerans]|uniref:hypothetical protein n=1 Tax=Desulfitibacter alkalitolerans TaxID=264641 RepID=UPI0004858044|nr:hypothetical protein [Desulfitibacter alkalitolerans]